MAWNDFEWDPESVPALKLGLHIAQIVLAFVVFALEISVFKDSKAAVVGNNGWTFGVCFLSIPAWIYLAMTPRFQRTRRFAQPVVMAVVDGVFAVFWLSAFASQAAYNTANQCGNACGQSKGIVGLAFVVFILFCASTFVSIYCVKYMEWHNRLPGYDSAQAANQNIDPDKAAFSMAPHDDEAYAHVPMNDHDDLYGTGATDPYASGPSDPYVGASSGASHVGSAYDDTVSTGYVGAGRQPSQHSGYSGSGAPENPFRHQDNPFDDEPEYGMHQAGGNMGHPYAPPTAHEGYDDDRPAQFPAGNYDRHL